MNEFKSGRFVRYMKTQIDNNNIVYIQFEMWSNNLNNILEYKHVAFNREKNEEMSELEYYITCKIFIEILEIANYLHEQTPPLFHRGIKPANILFFEDGIKNGIFFKLSNFFITKIYDDPTYTSEMGSRKYMASEISDGTYDKKPDVTVYSLSKVAEQLFDLGNNLSRNDELGIYFKKIEKFIIEMKKTNDQGWPTCRDIIDCQEIWCLSSIHLTSFLFNDLSECQSLNLYINHHLNSIISDITVEYKDKQHLPRYMRFENNIDKFLICDKIPRKLKKISKCFYIFKTHSNDDEENSNLLFVTDDEKVFGIGKNKNGVLGLGHQNEVKEVEIIPELCDKNVKEFYNSEDFVLCSTSDYRLFSWGVNNNSKFGIGELLYFKPELIEYFNCKIIVQVCCGYQFSSVLTSDGRISLVGAI